MNQNYLITHLRGSETMLYTSSISSVKKCGKKLKIYYLMEKCGNDLVIPDKSDLEQYRKGAMTWQGFKVNYLAALMRSDVEKWMKKVADDAVCEDVVIVSDENDAEKSYRKLLAEMINNMFSGRMKVRYVGELNI